MLVTILSHLLTVRGSDPDFFSHAFYSSDNPQHGRGDLTEVSRSDTEVVWRNETTGHITRFLGAPWPNGDFDVEAIIFEDDHGNVLATLEGISHFLSALVIMLNGYIRTVSGFLYPTGGLIHLDIDAREFEASYDMSALLGAFGGEALRYAVLGSRNDDTLMGGRLDDSLWGNDGQDRLFGGNGNDFLYGGYEHDLLRGGGQNDELHGELGNDTLFGDRGDDTLYGGNNEDHLYGGFGNDALFGGANRDILNGELGNDTLSGDRGNDRVLGGAGDDYVAGSFDHDFVHGGADNDTVDGGHGNDTLGGGLGNDTFIFVDDFGTDWLTDFEATNDLERIDLSGVSAITDLTDLMDNHISQVGNDVVIDDLAGNTIRLSNVDLSDLDANDFIF